MSRTIPPPRAVAMPRVNTPNRSSPRWMAVMAPEMEKATVPSISAAFIRVSASNRTARHVLSGKWFSLVFALF